MAKVKIQGNASGTGILTVTAPNTSTDRTITLPDSTDTLAVNSDVTNKLPLAGGTMTGALNIQSAENSLAYFKSTDANANIKISDSNSSDINQVGIGAIGNNLTLIAGGDNRLSIDSTGAVTMPNQPAFSVYNNTAQDNIGSAWTTINMDTEIFDQNSDFNTGTYKFTAPVTGKYLLTAHVCTKNIDNGTQWYITGIQTSNRGYNGSRTTTHWDEDSNSFNHGVQITAVADMDASDTAYVRFYRYIGNATADIIAASEYSFFQGYLLG